MSPLPAYAGGLLGLIILLVPLLFALQLDLFRWLERRRTGQRGGWFNVTLSVLGCEFLLLAVLAVTK